MRTTQWLPPTPPPLPASLRSRTSCPVPTGHRPPIAPQRGGLRELDQVQAKSPQPASSQPRSFQSYCTRAPLETLQQARKEAMARCHEYFHSKGQPLDRHSRSLRDKFQQLMRLLETAA